MRDAPCQSWSCQVLAILWSAALCPAPVTPDDSKRRGAGGTRPPGHSWTMIPKQIYPPPCDIPSGCCFFTGPWTVTRLSLRMLRRVAAFCRPLRPVLLLVSFAEPSGWCAGAVPNVAWCAVCALAAPSSWRTGGCAGCCDCKYTPPLAQGTLKVRENDGQTGPRTSTRQCPQEETQRSGQENNSRTSSRAWTRQCLHKGGVGGKQHGPWGRVLHLFCFH